MFTWESNLMAEIQISNWSTGLGKGLGAVVPRLMETLLGDGYHVYVDNGAAACGTARKNCIKLPASFKNSRLKKGEHEFRK